MSAEHDYLNMLWQLALYLGILDIGQDLTPLELLQQLEKYLHPGAVLVEVPPNGMPARYPGFYNVLLKMNNQWYVAELRDVGHEPRQNILAWYLPGNPQSVNPNEFEQIGLRVFTPEEQVRIHYLEHPMQPLGNPWGVAGVNVSPAAHAAELARMGQPVAKPSGVAEATAAAAVAPPSPPAYNEEVDEPLRQQVVQVKKRQIALEKRVEFIEKLVKDKLEDNRDNIL